MCDTEYALLCQEGHPVPKFEGQFGINKSALIGPRVNQRCSVNRIFSPDPCSLSRIGTKNFTTPKCEVVTKSRENKQSADFSLQTTVINRLLHSQGFDPRFALKPRRPKVIEIFYRQNAMAREICGKTNRSPAGRST